MMGHTRSSLRAGSLKKSLFIPHDKTASDGLSFTTGTIVVGAGLNMQKSSKNHRSYPDALNRARERVRSNSYSHIGAGERSKQLLEEWSASKPQQQFWDQCNDEILRIVAADMNGSQPIGETDNFQAKAIQGVKKLWKNRASGTELGIGMVVMT